MTFLRTAVLFRGRCECWTLVFHGGSLNGQMATCEQVSNPPTKSQPPTVTFKESGDSCQPPL